MFCYICKWIGNEAFVAHPHCVAGCLYINRESRSFHEQPSLPDDRRPQRCAAGGIRFVQRQLRPEPGRFPAHGHRRCRLQLDRALPRRRRPGQLSLSARAEASWKDSLRNSRIPLGCGFLFYTGGYRITITPAEFFAEKFSRGDLHTISFYIYRLVAILSPIWTQLKNTPSKNLPLD